MLRNKKKTNVFRVDQVQKLWDIKSDLLTLPMDLKLAKKGMKIGHLNIQHILSKIYQLNILLTKENKQVEILVLTEIFLEKHLSKAS